MGWRYDWKPYVPVAQRRAQAAREVAKRLKSGQAITPIVIEGRAIVTTFWGKAWCENLESYSDYENRLPRGRTYVRNGSVVHLKIEKGRIEALVSGSELYTVRIDIVALPRPAWEALKRLCAGKIGSLVELLQGKLSNAVMQAVTNRNEGLFPKPKEITMRCSCPDSAGMCKHLAAVMYGVGSRLDTKPELLFQLRGVDHQELIEQAIPKAPSRAKGAAPTIESAALGAIFDIEIEDTPPAATSEAKAPRTKAPKSPKVPAAKSAPAPAPAPAAAAPKPAPVRKAAEKKAAPVKKAAPKKSSPATKATPVKKAAPVTKAAAPTKKKSKPVSK
jgi:uncharacterized Zn finger protein